MIDCKVVNLRPTDPLKPRYAVVGRASGVVIKTFHKRVSAEEFAAYIKHEGGPR